jgi:hypothetical protein
VTAAFFTGGLEDDGAGERTVAVAGEQHGASGLAVLLCQVRAPPACVAFG